MNKPMTRLFAVLIFVSALVGCRTVTPPPTPIPKPAASTQVVQALNRVGSLQAEIKELRNLVEVQQFELDSLKKRQRELYDDLDLRVRQQERSAGAGYQNNTVTLSQPAVGSDGQLATDGTLMPDTTTTNLEVIDGSVDTVLVAPANQASDPLAEQEAYDRAFDLLKQSRYQDSIAAFEDLINDYPNSEFSDDAYYWIGEAHYVSRDFNSALSVFDTVTTRFPSSQRVPDAMLKMGYIQYETGDYVKARQTLTSISTRFPGNRVAISANTRLQKMDADGL